MSDDAAHSEQVSEEEHSLVEWALDAFVYAPTGLVLTVVEDMPELVAKGRERIDQQVRNARFVGRFVVDHTKQDLGRRLGRNQATSSESVDVASQAAPAAPAPRPEPVAPAAPFAPAPSDLAIPDYDTLSASQVVRRLDGLGPTELEAVYRHEAGSRGRRTILHRAQQLLGTEDLPGH